MKKKIKRSKNLLLSKEDFKAENVEIKVKFFITIDVLTAYMEAAHAVGLDYQDLMILKLKKGIKNNA